MCHFFKVLLAAFIVSLSISSLSEASFFSPAPKEDPRVAELAQMVDVSGHECDVLDEKTIRIHLLNSVIDVQREKLDSQNKIIEQQNEMLIGTFIFISGVLFGAALLFVGLQRHAKTQDKNTPSLKIALIELSVSLLVMIPLVRLMSGWYDAYDDNKLGVLLRLICILHLYFFASICFGFSIFNIVSVLKEKRKTER